MIFRYLKYAALAVLLIGILRPASTDAANLYFFPASAVKSASSEFTVSVYVNSIDQAMNAVSGVLDFPADKLRVVSLSKSNSIVNLWVQEPSFSNAEGKIRFEGVVLNPGYTGTTGRIIGITFKPKRAGPASLTFSSGAVLANDGQGTNILTEMGGANYSLQAYEQAGFPEAREAREATTIAQQLPAAPVIKSTTHPSEDSWYNGKNLMLSWDIPPGVDGVSYALEASPTFQLVPQGRGLLSNVSYDVSKFADGIWYFHLRYHTSAGWGPVSRRAVRMDFTPPEVPILSRVDEDDPTSPRPVFGWKSKDAASGIAQYQMKIGEGDWFDPGLPTEDFRLPLQAPGERQLTIRAIDGAGNRTYGGTVFLVRPIPAPSIVDYTREFFSPSESFRVRGTADAQARIRLVLNKDGKAVMWETPADGEGNWQSEHSERLASGDWELRAHAVDDRGALSLETDPVTVTVVSPWIRVARAFAQALAALGWVLLGGGILLLFGYLTFRKSVLQRMRLRSEFLEFKTRVRNELQSVERNLETLKETGHVDPANPSFRDAEKRLKSELARLRDDVRAEARRIDE